MPEMKPTERVLPCLLDRLTDDEPRNRQEGRDRRVLNLPKYRQAVLRDIGWLLNTSAHGERDGLGEFEGVMDSVVNFGTRDVTGLSASAIGVEDLEKSMVEALRRFEPRVSGKSLAVRVTADPGEMSGRAVRFEISGELWAQPIPEALFIKTEMDLETGECKLDQPGKSAVR